MGRTKGRDNRRDQTYKNLVHCPLSLAASRDIIKKNSSNPIKPVSSLSIAKERERERERRRERKERRRKLE